MERIMIRKTLAFTLVALILVFSLCACEILGEIAGGDINGDGEITGDGGNTSTDKGDTGNKDDTGSTGKPDDGNNDVEDKPGEGDGNTEEKPDGDGNKPGDDSTGEEVEGGDNNDTEEKPGDNVDPDPEIKLYDVIFYCAFGPDSTDVQKSSYAEDSLIVEPEPFDLEGYKFDGWYSDELFENKWSFDTDKVKSDMNLYAKWNELPREIKPATIYLVGDSTVCSFNDKYFYPRYGYGTQLQGYLTDKATVVNLALSGRSSKSFIQEANYQTLVNSLSEGDYLIIGFGHNDEKSDDDTRFTDASKPYTDETSFGYYLLKYYVELAKEKGATPILCTPIVRAASDNDYTGAEGHVTQSGDYRAAIIALGEAYGVPVVDLTAITAVEYETLGFAEALKYHAVIAGKYDSDGTTVVPNMDTVDKTHLNVYGAKYVAYTLASELKKIDGIRDYVADGITAPTEADRVQNPDYVVPDYEAPDLDNYKPQDKFSTVTDGWYGTAFGNTGGDPRSDSNGFIAKETSEGVFSVGCTKSKGKFENASDGFAFVFRQVKANEDFKLTATAKVTADAGVKQAGFGLMLRDDCIIGQSATSTINTNYLTAGLWASGTTSSGALFYRENTTFNKGVSAGGIYSAGDTATLTIERIGQTVTVTVVYGGNTYTESFYDFDLFARDTEYMYVGMFANRGTVVEFTDVVFTITGESQGA